MAMYGAFSSSILGMMSQSKSLNTIGTNIANINTGGYKKTETRFETVLSRTISFNSDYGGVRPKDFQRIEQQGVITSTGRNLDAAISGNGFFVLNTEVDGSGETLYTRDGSFETRAGNAITVPSDDGTSTINTREMYLVNKNGYYVMGWQPDTTGAFSTTGTLSAMRVDPYAFIDSGQTTTNANLKLNLPSTASENDVHGYNIQTYDSNGASRILNMEFTKQAANGSWEAFANYTDTPAAQVDTITIAGTIEATDQYTVTVNGVTVTHTVAGTEASVDDITASLISQINADSRINQSVTATTGATGEIVLTANTAGTAFTSTAQAFQGPASTAQVDTVTIGGTVEVGDEYSITVDGVTVTTTAGALDTLTTIRDSLVAQLNAHPTLGGTVTAAPSAAIGALTITADTSGLPFVSSAAALDVGGNPDNTASSVTTTANITVFNDNTAGSVTTTANDDGSRTTAPVTLTFDSLGQLTSPADMTFNLTWNDASTLAMTLDISEMTQYSGDFTPYSYFQNGYGSGQVRDISFDSEGHVVASFSNTQARSVYQLGLAVFSNPNSMETLNGNLYRPGPDTGDVVLTSAQQNGYAVISPNARELSNVNIADEFTNMIVTQQAYNSSATVFRTVDEMTVTARDLKR